MLGEIQQLIQTYNPAHVIHTYNPAHVIHTYNPAHVIYGGDMNTDLTRNHAYALIHFISDFNLTPCVDAPDAQVPYTYVSPNGLTSRIDNFFTTANLGQKVLEYAIIDNLLFSDHVPLKVRLDINVDHMFEMNYVAN